MRPGTTPHFVTQLQPFQHATINNLETATSDEQSATSACVTKDGRAAWIVRGPSLEVVDTETRNCLASWRFGVSLRDTHSYITCVKEYDYGNSIKLLVGVCNSSNTGMLCVFDVGLSRVTKSMEIPQKVTAVEPITNVGGDHVPVWALNDHLRHFYGIVSVGTEAGIVYLIDMCLDDDSELSDEVMPYKLEVISPRSRDVAQRRVQASSRDHVLCMILDDEVKEETFSYRRCDGSVIKTFQSDDVYISCLKYIPQIGNLILGFSFGCYQLWRLYVPVLEYSSRLEPEMVPITHVSYQEPENDPKNFSYLWVSRGASKLEEDITSYITLYQLAYNKKTWYSNYGAFYEELTSVSLRFDLDLSSSPSSVSSSKVSGGCSRVVSCYTLADPDYVPLSRLLEEESFEESVHGPDLSLCAFVWESTDEQSTRSSYHLGIFDMNRWYHAQMPASLRSVGSALDTCSYFSFLSLDEAVEAAATDSLLAVHVDTHKLRKFINNCPLPPEQHFYPASLAFDVTLVMETGLVKGHYLGTQRQVLASMQKVGPSILLSPKELYNLCVYMGLLPRPLDAASRNLSPIQMREALLSMALDNGLLPFIIKCIHEWSAGEYVHHSCTLKVLLDWAWERVAQVKQTIDTISVPLYDWSGLMLDKRSIHTLHQCHQKLTHFNIILKALISQSAPTTEQGFHELQNKLSVVTYLTEHLEMVKWFIGAGLLPENDEVEELYGSRYSYPAGSLIQAYQNRRREIQKIDSSIGEMDILMVDGIVEQMGPSVCELWDSEGGNGLYPPPSLHAMLSVYLLDGIDVHSKHALLLYLLLDLVSLAGPEWHEQFAEKISKFASSFSLPFTLVKQIQGFWLLDHKDFEEAMVVMLDPLVLADLGRWQHCRVIRSLLYQGDQKMALRYLNSANPSLTTPDEVKLKLTVLLANGLTAEALEYQRTYRDQTNMYDLLHHLFLGCQQTKTVDQLLQLPLTETEESLLVDYLSDSSEPYSQELLVMHYLQRARYVEAIRLNEKLKQSVMPEASSKARERAAVRNAMVEGFLSVLSRVQRKLIFENQHLPKKNTARRREVRRPEPLSTTITRRNTGTVKTQSSLFLEVMERVRDVKCEDEDENIGPSRSESDQEIEPFICTPVTPRLQSRINHTMPVVYPAIQEYTTSIKDGRSAKKSANTTLQSFFNSSKYASPTANTNKYKMLGAKAMSLLETPKVIKKTPQKRRASSAMLMTPQSILKVKNMIAGTPSPQLSSSNTSLKGSAELRGTPLLQGPKRLGFNDSSAPGTPRSVSFMEASVTGTPKQLRFAEASQIDVPPRLSGSLTKMMKSPPSPKSVRERSPTPESISQSPKYASKTDKLKRPPIRDEERLMSEDEIEVDDQITFNFTRTNKTEEENMETADTSTDTLPVNSPPSEVHEEGTPSTPTSPISNISNEQLQKSPASILKSRSPKLKLDRSPRVMFADTETSNRDVVSTSSPGQQPIEIDLIMEDEDEAMPDHQEIMEVSNGEDFSAGLTCTNSSSSVMVSDSTSTKSSSVTVSEPDSSSDNNTHLESTTAYRNNKPSTSLYEPKDLSLHIKPSSETQDISEESSTHIPDNTVVRNDYLEIRNSAPQPDSPTMEENVDDIECSVKNSTAQLSPLSESVENSKTQLSPLSESVKTSTIQQSPLSESVENSTTRLSPLSESVKTSTAQLSPLSESVKKSSLLSENVKGINGDEFISTEPKTVTATESLGLKSLPQTEIISLGNESDASVGKIAENYDELEDEKNVKNENDFMQIKPENDFTQIKSERQRIPNIEECLSKSDSEEISSRQTEEKTQQSCEIDKVSPLQSSVEMRKNELVKSETPKKSSKTVKRETPSRKTKKQQDLTSSVIEMENEIILSPRRGKSPSRRTSKNTNTTKEESPIKIEASPSRRRASKNANTTKEESPIKTEASPSRRRTSKNANITKGESSRNEAEIEIATPTRHSLRLEDKYTPLDVSNSQLKSVKTTKRESLIKTEAVIEITTPTRHSSRLQTKYTPLDASGSQVKSVNTTKGESPLTTEAVIEITTPTRHSSRLQTKYTPLDASGSQVKSVITTKGESPLTTEAVIESATPTRHSSRLQTKFTEIKTEKLDVSDSQLKSPGRPSRQKNTPTRTRVEEEIITDSITEATTPSRRSRGRPKKTKTAEEVATTSQPNVSTNQLEGLLLTPPESGKDSPDKSEEEKQTKRKSKSKSPSRQSTSPCKGFNPSRKHDDTSLLTPTRRSSRLLDRDSSKIETIATEIDDPTSEPVAAVSPTYQFAEPMEVEVLKSEITNLKKSAGPLKSFIFSPPLTRRQSIQRDESIDSLPSTSLLLPTEADTSTFEQAKTTSHKDDSRKRQTNISVAMPESLAETSLLNDPPKEKKAKKATKKKIKNEADDSIILISPVVGEENEDHQIMTRTRSKRLMSHPMSLRATDTDVTKTTRTKKKRVAKLW